jgi:hypothetical protein
MREMDSKTNACYDIDSFVVISFIKNTSVSQGAFNNLL